MRSVAVRIEGRVQGVGFRAWTRRQAARLSLAGWVRNEPDGTVSALFSGPEELVEEMVALCRRGPPGSVVLRIGVSEAEHPAPGAFTILRNR